MRNRDDLVNKLRSGEVPDILIIGGGINGVGVFRDLAAQGIPALLVEAGDFASGTSSAPSRLIHGGLRYLETGEAALVRESLTERNLLLKNAHHVVHPLPVWVPLTKIFAGAFGAAARFLRLTTKPGPKGAIPLKIGLTIYDLFGKLHKTMPNHRMLWGKAARAELAELSEDVIAVGEYYDARISHPERLVMELIADAEADCPDAMAIPYLAAGDTKDGAIELVDRQGQASFAVSPKLVINAAGAWVDKVQTGLGFSGRLMGGTRGTHLVVRKPALTKAMKGKMLYFETADHRACLALPIDARHIYLGTTDIRVNSPDERDFTEEEIDYIFDVMRPILPNVPFTRDDVVFVMAGIRPLPYQDTETAAQISRDHRLDKLPATEDRPFDTLVLVGGKWTTYRAFAEHITDTILERRGAPRVASTADMVIGGARDLPADTDARAEWIEGVSNETGLSIDRIATLVTRYGSKARDVAREEGQKPARYDHLPEYSPAEIALICRTERISRLQDIVLRRTLMGFEGAVTKANLPEIAATAAEVLGWDKARTVSEIAEVTQILRDRHRVTLT